MSVDTYYTVLGVPETATQAEIKAAYRSLIKQIHPDTVSTVSPYLKRIAEDKAKELTEAYSLLSDSGRRRQYDRQLAELRQQAVPPPPPQQASPQAPSDAYCSICGTPLSAIGHCPKCGRSSKAAAPGTTPSQGPPTRQGLFFTLIDWARKNPVAALLLCVVVLPALFALFLSSFLFPLIGKRPS